MPAPTYSETELHAAVEALADAERFHEAEQVVAAAAPGLQKVLAEALASGGWFEESHQSAIGDAARRADESERVALISTLIAEESRLAMMIGVAVGWALAGELSDPKPTNENEERDPMTDIRFLGHSCVELSDGDSRVLIDPFLKPNNPQATLTAEEVDPTTILVTHAHVDHLADCVGIAQRTGATVAAIVELANWLSEQGVEDTLDPNLGGTVDFPWGWAKLVQAFHTSTAPGSSDSPFSPTPGTVIGHAAGWVVNIGGKTVYHLGDTALFGDLALIAKRTPVDVALIPIGGHYTMDRHDAVVAAELIGAPIVIPVHHSTFAPIETDLEAFKQELEEKTDSEAILLEPGETYSA